MATTEIGAAGVMRPAEIGRSAMNTARRAAMGARAARAVKPGATGAVINSAMAAITAVITMPITITASAIPIHAVQAIRLIIRRVIAVIIAAIIGRPVAGADITTAQSAE